MTKRILAFLLTLIFLFPLFPHSVAVGNTYVAINNVLLPITDAMPIKSDGVWYIDYRCFTDGDLGVNGSYNPDSQTLALYTWDYTLAFHLMSGTATNKTTDNTYKQWAFHSNGTVYVPAKFVARQLGMTYSYIQSVNVLRIKTSSVLQDSMFAYIARDEIPRLIERYNASQPQKQDPENAPSATPESPKKEQPENKPNKTDQTNKVDPADKVDNQSPTDTPSKIEPENKTNQTEAEKEKTVYLTFDIGTETDCPKILSALRRANVTATFFVFGAALPVQDDVIRQISTEGHTLGISAFGATSEFLTSAESVKSDLAATNELLYQVCYTKSRLVRIPGGSATLSDEQANVLSESGYRYWDWDIDASAMSMQRFQTVIAAKGDVVVVRFDSSKNSVQNLSKILTYLSEHNYTVQPISLLTTPRNLRHDVR